PDVDGVVRQANLIVPYGRSKDFGDWDIYASLDVQTVRSYFRLPNEQVVLEYGPVGAYRILFDQSAQVRTDDLGRVVINFHGPGYATLDVVRRLPDRAFGGGRLFCISARLVAQLRRAGAYAEFQRASRLPISGAVRRKRKTPRPLRVWPISQS